ALPIWLAGRTRRPVRGVLRAVGGRRAAAERGRQAPWVCTRTLTSPGGWMTEFTELTDLTAVQLLDGYRGGEFGPVAATRAALARAEEIQPEVNALVRLTAGVALEQAAASEERWRRGDS